MTVENTVSIDEFHFQILLKLIDFFGKYFVLDIGFINPLIIPHAYPQDSYFTQDTVNL